MQIPPKNPGECPTLSQQQFYKLARPDGWDFYTHNTINYRENIGKTVQVPNFDGEPKLCSDSVLHASLNPNDAFVGAGIPCSVYIVKGIPVVTSKQKCGFKELSIIEEIPQEKFNDLFGWKYSEAFKPILPFEIKPPKKITKEHIALLKKWDSVRDPVRDSVWDSAWASVKDSVWDSVKDSVGDSVWASVWDSVWASAGDSVWDSVWDSVRASVWASAWDSVRASVKDSAWDSVRASVKDSVWDSVRAYIGSLFPNIKQWKYIKHKSGKYPFQPTVDLWKQGLVPSFDGKTWRLHGGKDAKILFEITAEKLKESAEP